jgi:ABC-type branched-subunit amino acid transport system ATPase component
MLLGGRKLSFLEVNNVDVSYGYAQVLHNVSFKMEKGECIFIVGRNGAGKTTLLKTICGLVNPTRGAIMYDGKNITKTMTEDLALQGIRFVAQDKKVFSSLTVRENLELAAYAVKEPIEKTLERTLSLYPPLEQFLQLQAGRLSGGQKEILLIARALVGKPRLMLIDEPTEGLASIVIEEVYRLLETMKGEVSVIVVEQNLNIVGRLADRVVVMKEGKIETTVTETEHIQTLEKYL